MNGRETQSDFSIGRRKSLDPSLLGIFRGSPSTGRAPVEAVHNRRDEMHKVGQAPGKDYGL